MLLHIEGKCTLFEPLSIQSKEIFLNLKKIVKPVRINFYLNSPVVYIFSWYAGGPYFIIDLLLF